MTEQGTYEPPTIAVLAVSALGDLLNALPMLGALRRLYPSCRITLVCLRPVVTTLACELGVSDAIVSIPARARRSPIGFLTALRRVRAIHADLAFQTFSSHGMFANVLLAATKAPIRCGFDDGRFRGLLTHRVPVRERRNYLLHNLDLLHRLGHVQVRAPEERYLPEIEGLAPLYTPQKAREAFGRFAVISLGSDPKLAFKRWPVACWADLTKRLTADGLTCVLIGDVGAVSDIEEVRQLAGGAGVNLAGKTSFPDVAGLLAASRVIIGTDGMILHLAAALQRGVVGIFGPTHPRNFFVDETGPRHDPNRLVYLNLPCSPCYTHDMIGQTVPCRTNECVRTIAVEQVYTAVRQYLAQEIREAPVSS